MTSRFLTFTTFALLTATAALAQSPPTRTVDGTLTDTEGYTLYTFDGDTAGRSTCTGECAARWRPLAAPPEAKPWADYTVVSRADGMRQWAYKGRPLYRWSKDGAPGDRLGDGLENAWRAAKP